MCVSVCAAKICVRCVFSFSRMPCQFVVQFSPVCKAANMFFYIRPSLRNVWDKMNRPPPEIRTLMEEAWLGLWGREHTAHASMTSIANYGGVSDTCRHPHHPTLAPLFFPLLILFVLFYVLLSAVQLDTVDDGAKDKKNTQHKSFPLAFSHNVFCHIFCQLLVG